MTDRPETQAEAPAHVRWTRGVEFLDCEVSNGFLIVFVPRGLPGEYRVVRARQLDGQVGLEALADGVVTTICQGSTEMLAALWIRASGQLCVQEPGRLAHTMVSLMELHPQLSSLIMQETARRLTRQGGSDARQA